MPGPGPAPPVPVATQVLQDLNPPLVMMRILGEESMGPERSLGLPYWAVYTAFCLLSSAALTLWSAARLKPRREGGKITGRQ